MAPEDIIQIIVGVLGLLVASIAACLGWHAAERKQCSMVCLARRFNIDLTFCRKDISGTPNGNPPQQHFLCTTAIHRRNSLSTMSTPPRFHVLSVLPTDVPVLSIADLSRLHRCLDNRL